MVEIKRSGKEERVGSNSAVESKTLPFKNNSTIGHRSRLALGVR